MSMYRVNVVFCPQWCDYMEKIQTVPISAGEVYRNCEIKHLSDLQPVALLHRAYWEPQFCKSLSTTRWGPLT